MKRLGNQNLFFYAVTLTITWVSFLYSWPSSRLPEELKIVFKGSESNKNLHLVLGGGPTRYTPSLLNILKKYKISATFCLVGQNIDRYPTLAQKVKEAGHTICSQFYQPPKANTQTDQALVENLSKMRTVAEQVLNVLPTVFLPLSYDINITYIQASAVLGARWILLPRIQFHTKGTSMDKDVQAMVEQVQAGDMILIPESSTSIKVLPQMIKTLSKRGFHFVSLQGFLKRSAKTSAQAKKRQP